MSSSWIVHLLFKKPLSKAFILFFNQAINTSFSENSILIVMDKSPSVKQNPHFSKRKSIPLSPKRSPKKNFKDLSTGIYTEKLSTSSYPPPVNYLWITRNHTLETLCKTCANVDKCGINPGDPTFPHFFPLIHIYFHI